VNSFVLRGGGVAAGAVTEDTAWVSGTPLYCCGSAARLGFIIQAELVDFRMAVERGALERLHCVSTGTRAVTALWRPMR
jgi:hypothetical protein